MTQRPFTSDVRQQILLHFFETLEEAEGLSSRKTKRSCVELRHELWQLREQYCSGVPIIPISRCPYCQQIIHLRFDYFDLDGLFWLQDGVSQLRADEITCPHFWTLSGALKLGSPIVSVPSQILSGYEVPFVMTSALQQQGMKVVVSSVKVANHTAYPILYFSASKPIRLETPFQQWLSTVAVWVQEYGQLEMKEAYRSAFEEYADFDLAPWIQKGQLLWIALDDSSLLLKETVEDCPYLDLPGTREFVSIYDGKASVLRYINGSWKHLDIRQI